MRPRISSISISWAWTASSSTRFTATSGTCTIIQYVKSVHTLLSAGMEETVPSVTEYLNNLNSNSANEKPEQNDQNNWL